MTNARRAELLSAGFAPASSPTIPCSKAPEGRPIVAYAWKPYRSPAGKVSRRLNPILVSLAADEAARRVAAERFTAAILSPNATNHAPQPTVNRRYPGRNPGGRPKGSRTVNRRVPAHGKQPETKPSPARPADLVIKVIAGNEPPFPRTTRYRRATDGFKKPIGPRRFGQPGICLYHGCSNEKALVYDGRPARMCRWHLDRYMHSVAADRCQSPNCESFAWKGEPYCTDHLRAASIDPEAVGF